MLLRLLALALFALPIFSAPVLSESGELLELSSEARCDDEELDQPLIVLSASLAFTLAPPSWTPILEQAPAVAPVDGREASVARRARAPPV